MTIAKRLLAALTGGCLCIAASAQIDRGYQNPVIPGMYPDPSVCRVGNDYYLVNSTFQYFPGVPIFHSNDLIHWNQIGNVLDRPSQLPLKNANAWLGIYAPTIRYNNGTYYMVTSNIGNSNGTKSNFFVTATDPAGPWSEPIWLDQGGIDPSFYFEDGKCYFTSNPDIGIWLCEIDPKTGEQLTESKLIWEGTGGRHPEAPHIYKKDGYYYLVIAEGGTEMGHMVTIARSRDIYGPYEANPDNPILYHQRKITQASPIQGTGHADLVQAADGSWWMVCLAFRPQINGMHLTGRETYLAPVEWNADGWPVVNGNGTISIDMDVPTLPQTPAKSREAVYDFAQMTGFGHEWVHLRNPHFENYRFTSRGLELTGTSATMTSIESPTFAALRQQDIDFTLTSTFSMTDALPGAEAGISIYMDVTTHYDLFIRENADSTQSLVLSYQLHSISGNKAIVPLPAGENVTVKIDGKDDRYTFSYSTGGAEFTTLGSLDTRFLSTETAGGFTGVTIGAFASGHCTGIFRNLSYTPAK